METSIRFRKVKIYRPNQCGIGLIELATVGALIAVTLTLFVGHFFSQSKVSKAQSEKVWAELYAAELLEAFLALQNGSGLKDYMQTNPVQPSLSAYYLCSHINLLDRQGNRILNADPIAEGPFALGDRDKNSAQRTNRFYVIQVVDLDTLTVKPSFCDRTVAAVYPLASNLRFLVTVGVSWVPEGSGLGETKQVALSGVLRP